MFRARFCPSDKEKFHWCAQASGAISRDTTPVSINMAVNNEIGSIQPIQPSELLASIKPTIHVDAVQAVTKIPTAVYLTDRVDFATFSSHKFHILGVWDCLYQVWQRKSTAFDWWRSEMDKRSTTENLVALLRQPRPAFAHGKARSISGPEGRLRWRRFPPWRAAEVSRCDIFSDMEDFVPCYTNLWYQGSAWRLSFMYLKTTRRDRLPALALLRLESQQNPNRYGGWKSIAQSMSVSVWILTMIWQMEQFWQLLKITTKPKVWSGASKNEKSHSLCLVVTYL